jgi:hypothetical protein
MKFAFAKASILQVAMHMWIAIKSSPLCLLRDPVTHVNKLRLDKQWFLPAFCDLKYAVHVEVVLTHPCTKSGGPRSKCLACDALPAAIGKDQFDTKHYLTYSVDAAKSCVYRSTKRHIVAPQVVAANEEHWSYWKVPNARAPSAFAFLEQQLGKPIRPKFSLNFWLLCRREGVLLDSDYNAATHWYCSELAAATLIMTSDAFASQNVKDPCLISPCVLENMLRDLADAGVVEAEVSCIPALRSVRTFSAQ